MMSCDRFRRDFGPGCEDAAMLQHLRTCDACLAQAVESDPDAMFRAIGGEEMAPPGGVDAFVSDVMREVHLRSTENSLEPVKNGGWMRRLAVAATLAAGITGAALFYQSEQSTGGAPAMLPARAARIGAPLVLSTKPVIENYDSPNATIIEVPAEAQTDVKVVMIFDESLPADL